MRTTIPLTIGLLIIISSFFIFPKSALAINAPQLDFVDGDGLYGIYGEYDVYDSLIIFEITTSQPSDFIEYNLQYSIDGQGWQDINPDCDVIDLAIYHYKCYWSTSKIYAPTALWFKAYSIHTSGNSEEYITSNLSLTHRFTNWTNKIFVESFIDNIYEGDPSPQTAAVWDTDSALVELPPSGESYEPQAFAVSENLLQTQSNIAPLTWVEVQPVHVVLSQYPHRIGYKVSNDGLTWYPAGSNWHYFPFNVTVPDLWHQDFDSSVGNELYWRAKLQTNNTDFTPRMYQLRLDWEENHTPQACFIVNPTVNLAYPQQIFDFNANCSSDYEDSLNQLDFRWDWESDGVFNTPWRTGDYTEEYIFNSTTTFAITLEVKDTLETVDSYQTSINEEESYAGDIYGWIWGAVSYGTGPTDRIGSGWTSLNCDNTFPFYYPQNPQVNLCGGVNNVYYGLEMDDQNIRGWAWNQYWGWLCVGDTCESGLYGFIPEPPGSEIESWAIYSRTTGEVQGWGKFIGASGTIYSQNEQGWLKLRGGWCDDPGTPKEEEDYCVKFNFELRTMEGFAWSGWYEEPYSTEIVGPGWQSFQGELNIPWLETLYGTMYSGIPAVPGGQQSITPPPNRYTASYCILSSDIIVNFTSGIGCTEESYETIQFPQQQNQYRNILGVIDFDRILDGNETVYTNQDIDGSLPNILGDKVYHFTSQSDYTIDQPFTIFNGHTLDSSGAGTVVIEGDLLIDSNFYYEEAAVTGQIENLASITWIVKGDLIIDPAVSHIVGAFIVLGTEGVSYPNPGSGFFETGDDSANPLQLVVKGLVMAREIVFERYYKVGSEPAEQIIYDGRVLVNTPPGLEDFAKALPRWQETFATTQIEE